MYFIMLFSFKCWIEDKSKKGESFTAFGKNYFFMTQDQIQNACKSIIKSFPGEFKNNNQKKTNLEICKLCINKNCDDLEGCLDYQDFTKKLK